ncbi:PREDICTED: kinesin-1 heavy chain-like [Acropora digitifera]|uniref:kinesin-1 heavy chain-like n=1 Tax=Acropora digitifera TaxID=70779 RepID=UPI00077A8117|nr:PREDICTED: kinesin-1 heavy chain-like [Acropora digitifera]
MKAVDTFADSQRETKEQEIDNLKDQVEKLLMERNQLQTQLDQFRKNSEVGLNRGDQTDAIKEQTLQENENIDEIQHQEVEVNYEMATKECEENKFYVKELGDQLNKVKAERDKTLKSLKTLKVNHDRLKNKLKEMSSSQEDLSKVPVKELRKTLSVMKIEKEDMDAALSDNRKELEALELKNKVQTANEFHSLTFLELQAKIKRTFRF